MKRFFRMVLPCMILMLLSACSGQQTSVEERVWDCSVSCAKESAADAYIITYSDTEIVSKEGALSFQNRNDFDITVHLLAAGKEQDSFTVHAGGVTVLYRIEKGLTYTIGCHADVAENTQIQLLVYDGERADTFS